jgi:hypothetical protein
MNFMKVKIRKMQEWFIEMINNLELSLRTITLNKFSTHEDKPGEPPKNTLDDI